MASTPFGLTEIAGMDIVEGRKTGMDIVWVDTDGGYCRVDFARVDSGGGNRMRWTMTEWITSSWVQQTTQDLFCIGIFESYLLNKTLSNAVQNTSTRPSSPLVAHQGTSVEVRCRCLQSSPVPACHQPFGRHPHGSVAASHRQRQQRRRRRRAVDGVYGDDFNGAVPCCSSGRWTCWLLRSLPRGTAWCVRASTMMTDRFYESCANRVSTLDCCPVCRANICMVMRIFV